MMTRRHFMGVLALLGAAAGLGGTIALRRRLSADGISSDEALSLRGARVSLRARSGPDLRGVIEDVTVVRRPSRRGAPGTEQISLLVADDRDRAPAGAYRVETDDASLGELDFLPVGRAGHDRRLEAVITRIV